MSELDDSFEKLLGKQPSDTERQNLYRVRDALGLKNNDALWLVLMALQHYEKLYAGIPAEINKAAKVAASSSAEQAQAAVNEAVAALVPSVEKAVSNGARSAIAQVTLGKSAFTLVLAGLVVGAVLGVGMLLGARIFAAAAEGHISWDVFWSQVGWSLGLGAGAPGLIMLGTADFGEEKTWWQWLALVSGFAFFWWIGYRLVSG